MFFLKSLAFFGFWVYVYSMLDRKELNAKIGELASALEIMNANATPETALTVKVANEVFGKRLAEMQKRLAEIDGKVGIAKLCGSLDKIIERNKTLEK